MDLLSPLFPSLPKIPPRNVLLSNRVLVPGVLVRSLACLVNILLRRQIKCCNSQRRAIQQQLQQLQCQTVRQSSDVRSMLGTWRPGSCDTASAGCCEERGYKMRRSRQYNIAVTIPTFPTLATILRSQGSASTWINRAG